MNTRTIENCKSKTVAKSMCDKHYRRLLRTGSIQLKIRQPEKSMIKTSEYASWVSMKARCYNKNNHNYPRYGAKGIGMFNDWRYCFVAFYEYMGDKPSIDYTIDRIDSNGNYEPGNVRWASAKQQARNRSNNRMVTIGGVTKTLVEWAEDRGINYKTVKHRLWRGYSEKLALGISDE